MNPRHLVHRVWQLALAAVALGATPALAIDRGLDLVSGGSQEIPAAAVGASADGQIVYFTTDEPLVPSDLNAKTDVYMRTSAGALTLVSGGGAASTGAVGILVSTDGSRVFFATDEALVAADTDTTFDVYARTNGVLTMITAGVDGLASVVATPDGSRAYFGTFEALVATDDDVVLDIYERRLSDGALILVSDDGDDGPGTDPALLSDFLPVIVPDGSRVVFRTADRLHPRDDDGTSSDVYVRDNTTGALDILSDIDDGNADPATSTFTCCHLTPDASRVFFGTAESFTAADTDGAIDTYEWSAGQLTLISGGTDPAFGVNALVALATDGSRALFSSGEGLLGADGDGATDLYERTRPTGVLRQVTPGIALANTDFAYSSTDLTRVYFTTAEALPGAGDGDIAVDLYEVNSAGGLRLVSGGTANVPAEVGFSWNQPAGRALAGGGGRSQDGSAAFFSTTEQLLPADRDGVLDIYERQGDTLSLIPGVSGGSAAELRTVSTTGDRVTFVTNDRLLPSDTDSAADVYLARPWITLTPTVRLRTRTTARGFTVREMLVRNLLPGSTVLVRCIKACKFRKTFIATRTSHGIGKPFRGRTFPRKAVLEVRVTKPFEIGRAFRYAQVGRIVKTTRCAVNLAGKVTACKKF